MTKAVGTMSKPMLRLAQNLGVTNRYPRTLWASPPRQGYGRRWFLFWQSRPMANPSTMNMGSYRTLFPFFLIIAVVLLLIWRLVVSPGLSIPTKKCPEGTSSYWAQPGDNCWEISRKNGWSLENFKEINPNVVCDPLMPGTSMCLPPLKKQARRRMWYLLLIGRQLWTCMYTYDISLGLSLPVKTLLVIADVKFWLIASELLLDYNW